MARPNGNSGGKNNGGKTKEPGSERIARRIARAGVCSRRDAEKLITAGRVVVNGVTPTALRFAPPLIIGSDHIAEAVAILGPILDELQEG